VARLHLLGSRRCSRRTAGPTAGAAAFRSRGERSRLLTKKSRPNLFAAAFLRLVSSVLFWGVSSRHPHTCPPATAEAWRRRRPLGVPAVRPGAASNGSKRLRTWNRRTVGALFRARRSPRSKAQRPRRLRPVVPPPPRTKWTRRVPHPVLIGHAASLPPFRIHSTASSSLSCTQSARTRARTHRRTHAHTHTHKATAGLSGRGVPATYRMQLTPSSERHACSSLSFAADRVGDLPPAGAIRGEERRGEERPSLLCSRSDAWQGPLGSAARRGRVVQQIQLCFKARPGPSQSGFSARQEPKDAPEAKRLVRRSGHDRRAVRALGHVQHACLPRGAGPGRQPRAANLRAQRGDTSFSGRRARVPGGRAAAQHLVSCELRDLLHAPRAEVAPEDELVVREAVRGDKLLVVHRPLGRSVPSATAAARKQQSHGRAR